MTQIDSTRTCALWCTADDVATCGTCSGLDPTILAMSIELATDLLYQLSGQKFPGICTDTVRPIATGVGLCGDRYLRDAVIQGKIWSYDYAGCGTHGFAGCGCDNFQQVRLGSYPITAVSEVKVDGIVLDPTAYEVLDQQWLVRVDDGTFPTCQDVREPSTELGTFEVTLQYGIAPPISGVRAAAKLACEFTKACDGGGEGECELPERVQTLTRQGVTMAVIDPHDFLDHGRTGLYLVDLFLKAHNPDGQSSTGAMVQSPDYKASVRRRT